MIELDTIDPVKKREVNNSWSTPNSLFSILNKEFNFTFDVCASLWNKKCQKYFDKEADALKCDWPINGIGWMNPPYGNSHVQSFMKKAYGQTKSRDCTIVCLVPANTEREWFHKIALRGEIRVIQNRVHFTDKFGKTGRPMFANIIVILDPADSGAGVIKHFDGYMGGR